MNREDISKAALRVLNADSAASMATIAAAAGISRATLHRQFAGRNDLIAHLGWLSLQSWERAIETAGLEAAIAGADRQVMRRALAKFCGELIRDLAEYGFTLTEASLDADAEMVAASRALQDRENTFYAAAQAAGVIRSDLPVAWIGSALFGLLIGVREALHHGDIAVRDAERLLYQTLTSGVATARTDEEGDGS